MSDWWEKRELRSRCPRCGAMLTMGFSPRDDGSALGDLMVKCTGDRLVETDDPALVGTYERCGWRAPVVVDSGYLVVLFRDGPP